MQAVGVIVEYNPFHNGHFHHVQEAKRKTNSDVVVAVMSGHFLQRGEPALVDKWTRTKMALLSGVDLVIELPYVFATANAPVFALGATYLLDAMKCSTFAFGSEQGTIEPFLHTYELLTTYHEDYNSAIKEAIQQGNSYPKALHIAFEKIKTYSPSKTLLDLNQPNNILGYQYVEAVLKQQLEIQPATIQRIQAGYHDDINYTQSIASATGIRKALFEEKNVANIEKFVPSPTFQTLTEWDTKQNNFVNWSNIWPLLQYAILRHTPEQLRRFADVSEGLEHRLLKAAHANSFEQFMELLKSKRYTWTRLQRTFLHIFNGIEKEQLHAFSVPQYIRVLGMTENGQHYLSHVKKELPLPLISRVGRNDDPMLAIDLHATQMYNLILSFLGNEKMDGDYASPPIRI